MYEFPRYHSSITVVNQLNTRLCFHNHNMLVYLVKENRYTIDTKLN